MKFPLLCVQKFVFTRPASVDPKADSVRELLQEVSTTGDLKEVEPFPATIPGYFVVSTAPVNVEESEPPSAVVAESLSLALDQIVEHLNRPTANGSAPQLVIAIHGYNTGSRDAEYWYKNLFKYINRVDPLIQSQSNAVFLGYRWPSEKMDVSFPAIGRALAAMPIVPRVLLRLEFVISLLAFVLILVVQKVAIDALLMLLFFIAVMLGSIFLSLVLLRLSAYFRDSYRATNFGVPDLVELIRKLDLRLGENPNRSRVKLTLIGHSMGGFVVTNAVRILSDVFDRGAQEQLPDSCIGEAFQLERLILASPDIPVLTIASGRANFLASSLRRFAEAYLFSNQGDIVLRIASTAANYFSFPAGIRSSGYRLGNLAVRPNDYGIVNLQNLQEVYDPNGNWGSSIPQLWTALQQTFVTNLGVRDPLVKRQVPGSGVAKGMPASIAELSQERFKFDRDRPTIADLFSYFDCTDYVDVTDRSSTPTGVLSNAKRKPILGFWDYLALVKGYGKPYDEGQKDVHGGYFEGRFSKETMYRLAFLGFGGMLNGFSREGPVAIQQFDQVCNDKGIKLFLSPLRYRIAVQNQNEATVKNQFLDMVEGQGSSS